MAETKAMNISRFISLQVVFLLLLADRLTIGLSLLILQPSTNSKRTTTKICADRTCTGSQSPKCTTTSLETVDISRRTAFLNVAAATVGIITVSASTPQPALARAPGSTNVQEAILQIRDAKDDLKKLQRDWDQYALIDEEGRAVGDATVVARRILGGVAPLAGASAIQVATATPLYRIDGAFTVVRKASLDDDNDNDDGWGSRLDLPAFEEFSERIFFQVQKADGDLYSVAFASKGTKQISGIYKEAKSQVDQGVVDLEAMLELLKEAGAPGL